MKYQNTETGLTFWEFEVREMFDDFLDEDNKGDDYPAMTLQDTNPKEYESQFKAWRKLNGWKEKRKA